MKKFLVIAAIAGFALIMYAEVARADEYDPTHAGHPLRIVAYVAHPVGMAIDYILLRPCHWLVHRRGLDTIFGHETRMEKFKVQPYVRPSRKASSETIKKGETEEKDPD